MKVRHVRLLYPQKLAELLIRAVRPYRLDGGLTSPQYILSDQFIVVPCVVQDRMPIPPQVFAFRKHNRVFASVLLVAVVNQ